MNNANEQNENHSDVEFYGIESIPSGDAPIPRWLIFSYIFLPILGFWCMYYYFNGSHGWLDRGYWNQLQRAALTTYPYRTIQGEAEKDNGH